MQVIFVTRMGVLVSLRRTDMVDVSATHQSNTASPAWMSTKRLLEERMSTSGQTKRLLLEFHLQWQLQAKPIVFVQISFKKHVLYNTSFFQSVLYRTSFMFVGQRTDQTICFVQSKLVMDMICTKHTDRICFVHNLSSTYLLCTKHFIW